MPKGKYPRTSLLERFFLRVNKSENCWEWNGHLAPNGYGFITVDHRPRFAHRVSWKLSRGEIPAGLYVLHKCDNRKCIRPSHLFLGTALDNATDCVAKKRHRFGSKSGQAKLSEASVAEIRKLYSTGVYTQRALGELFGVCQSNISVIVMNKGWNI